MKDVYLTFCIALFCSSCSTIRQQDRVVLLLDRATVEFAAGDSEAAVLDYRSAIDAMDFYSQEILAEMAGKLLLQDNLGAYAGDDFEKLLARVYLSLALLHEGDENNAYAILRQGEELQQKNELVENALGKHLFALLSERKGDTSNAEILYRQSGRSGEKPLPDGATLLVICHNGCAPHKISVITDASLMSTVAFELFCQGRRFEPKLMSLSGIPVPALVYSPQSEPIPTTASVNDAFKPLEPIYNVGQNAREELAKKMPVIVARGVARYVMRRALLAEVDSRDKNLSAIVDLGLFIANLSTQADIRSWHTLPDRFDLARFELPAGDHVLNGCHTLHLKPHDLCIVHIFNSRTIQIPRRFL